MSLQPNKWVRGFYDLFVPRGRGRRLFFNDVSGAMALGCGMVGAVMGWNMAGLLGVFPGWGIGMVLGAKYLARSGTFARDVGHPDSSAFACRPRPRAVVGTFSLSPR
jgi:hypothetical protein